ncbi:uncharacterized protein N7503_011349 [Penicillium pulvis]|uniref:uncharacterized protein n=1 Tax=Penicillium pulvis TaxID=1562058 RepID=UPI002546BBF1|nr:uncharacterized protein N7503_011349 [Penicillium pulvis]KAJ5786137.1 hypothetical protein N7503_011349 [Penicillium pulvis]
MLAFLPLLLAFSSFATSAAIPSFSIPSVRDSSVPQSAGESTDLSRVSAQSANKNAEAHDFPQRTPYYFPETMPDNDEIAERLTALREAGFTGAAASEKGSETPVHQNQAHDQPQQSIDTPDVTTIDTARARMLILPDRESSAELDQSLESSYSPRTAHEIQNGPVISQALRIDWVISEAPILIATPPIIPSMMFLLFIAAILCIATVVRGVRHQR